jgi:hypothetical protein
MFVILSFFDREPGLARLCVVQVLRGGPRMLEYREEVLAGLVAVVDQGRVEGERGGECTVLTAEGLVGAALAIVHARLLVGGRAGPLVGLLGELMGLIVLPYLGSGAARRERTRPLPALAQPDCGGRGRGGDAWGVSDPLRGIPMRLTYRTVRVLEGVARNPGASNRAIAQYAEIHDQGQISKLLRRLEHLGLLKNSAPGGHQRGEPNAWTLTATGSQVAASISGYSEPHVQEAGA